MGNYLRMADRRRIEALLELGWSYRRIQRETGVDREAVARYDPGREGKSAKVPTGSMANAASGGKNGVNSVFSTIYDKPEVPNRCLAYISNL